MLRFFILSILCLFPFIANAAEKSIYDRVTTSGKIRCGYFTWAPYLMVDANTGKISGINYDYMELIGKTLGLKIEWIEEASLGTAIEGLNTGRYDVMCSSIWPDRQRLIHALFTKPTFFTTVYAVVRKDDTRFDSGKSLNSSDITISGIDGDVAQAIAQDDFPQAKILALPQNADGTLQLQNVANKKASLTFIDKGMVGDFNRTNGDLLKVIPNRPPVRVFPESLAVKKSEVELKLLLDQAIDLITNNNQPENLIKNYPNYEFYAPQPAWKKSN